MKFETDIKELLAAADVVGVALHDGFTEKDLDVLPGELGKKLFSMATSEHFKAGRGKKLVLPLVGEFYGAAVLVGLGKSEDERLEEYRVAAYEIVRAAATRGASSVALLIPGIECGKRCQAIGEGATLATYRFEKYHAADEDDRFKIPANVYIPGASSEDLAAGRTIALAQIYARDIANEPGNVINPETFERLAKTLAEELGLGFRSYDASQLASKGMNALLAVGSGSATPPRLVHLTYTPKGDYESEIALVGKGITFDSGGLSLKPAESMVTMKGDKSGACAVLGAIKACAELHLPIKLHAITGLAENMPAGSSYRPDDVVRAYNGKTIEVLNTDAEGRLTLADALAYACELKPCAVIDIATLTGACAVALGDNTAGLFSNNDCLAEAFLAAAKEEGERFWRLPIDDERLREKLKSPIADVLNSAGRYGGAITAAMFLEEFVDKDIPWVHLDIAATDFTKENCSYYVKGATAFGTRSLVQFLKESAGKKGE